MTPVPPAGGSGAPDPRALDRDALIALVEELQAENARQRAAIADLQRRPAPAANGNAGAPAGAPPRRRPAARPVPGFDYTLVFDGGALGNPGRGYGSYQIVGAAGVAAAERLEFGGAVTNNQAEFRTLIRALEVLRERLGPDAAGASLAVRGDSRLVINTVAGRWKARHPELVPLRERAAALLAGFGRVDLAWQPRDASRRVLGH